MCRLGRTIYGLKKTPCACYTHIYSYLSGFGFTKSETYANIYYIFADGNMLILVKYVDDLILT